MKRYSMISLFLVCAVMLAGTVQAQTVDEVVGKYIDAIGGKENWKKVNSMKMEASLSVQGMDVPINIYQINNKAMRTDYTVMNMTGYTIVTMDSGWNFNPMQGQSKPEPMTADELNLQKDNLDIQGDLLDYKDKGHKVELLGKEDVDGTECIKLKLTRKSNNETVYFIDPSNYYVIRTVSKIKVNGQEVEQKANLSNYQKLPEGILIPFTMENAGAPAPIMIKKAEINPTIDPSLFKIN
jgi:outer membrane lipoprotein-sorting protein